ncbi:MAG: GntR family transcriptional regulator [Desulfitobacteriaceae bacterium]
MKEMLEKYRGNFGVPSKPIPLEKAENHSSAQQMVFENLRDAILSGILPPGHRLLQDEISVELSVNRMVVREALLRLEADNLVDFHPYKGFSVASFSLDDLREIYFMRALLEGAAVQLACNNLTADGLKELEQICTSMDKCLESNTLTELSKLNVAFHETIYTAAKSPRLYKMIVSLWNGFLKSSIGFLTLRAPIMVQEHKAIYEALLERNSAKAKDRIEEHLESALKDLLEYWGQRIGSAEEQ